MAAFKIKGILNKSLLFLSLSATSLNQYKGLWNVSRMF